MDPSFNSTLQHLSESSSANRSASAPPSTSARPSSTSTTRTAGTPQHPIIKFHPLLEAQTNSFNESLEASENTLEMSNYSSSPGSGDYSYSSSNSAVPYGLNSTPISQSEINQMLQTLHTHRVNTLTEIRRIEKVLISVNALEYREPIRAAWNYYVASNNFLSELRGLTRQYPFSTDLLDNAKCRVYNDPSSGRSWNFVWLILVKLRNDQMVPEYATKTAYQPAMWGGVNPDDASVNKLAAVLTGEWTRAVEMMLRHWSTPPTDDGCY